MSNDIHIYIHMLRDVRTEVQAIKEFASSAKKRFKTLADKNGSKKRPGRPRLTEEEKARRAMQRALVKQGEPEANVYKRGMRKPWPALTE